MSVSALPTYQTLPATHCNTDGLYQTLSSTGTSDVARDPRRMNAIVRSNNLKPHVLESSFRACSHCHRRYMQRVGGHPWATYLGQRSASSMHDEVARCVLDDFLTAWRAFYFWNVCHLVQGLRLNTYAWVCPNGCAARLAANIPINNRGLQRAVQQQYALILALAL